MDGTVLTCEVTSGASSQGGLPIDCEHRPPRRLGECRLREGAKSSASRRRRACCLALARRGGLVAFGLLCVALLTATAASAQSADLSISVVDSPDPVAPGGVLSYTITVTNHGPNAATNVAMTTAAPQDTQGPGISAPPAGWTCALRPGSPFGQGAQVCTTPSLAPSGTASFMAQVGPFGGPTGTLLTNVSSVSSTTPDPNPANNVATTTTTLNPGSTVSAAADIAVAETGPAGPRLVGQNVVYTVTVTNNSGGNSPGPEVSDAIPPNTTFVSAVQTGGPAFACTTPAVGAAGAVVCVFDGLFDSAVPATFALTVQVIAGAPCASVPNVVTVAENGVDPVIANNIATLSTQVGACTPPARIPGDFNGDGFVDIRDYGVWGQNFGATNCGNPADADGNCLVDIRDYGIWRQHFGEGTPPDRR
jgi:uncharacterized repeat protein (TIGR01451 family)